MKVKLSKIYINQTGKDGQRLLNKKGEPYTMVTIKYDAEGEAGEASMYIGGKFGEKDLNVVSNWKEGDEVNLTFEVNGQYNNFSLPSKTDLLAEELFDIKERVTELERIIANAQSKKTEKTKN
jgi:hypothetical protein